MTVYPNAKINIGLNITEKRSDGYHTIETVFYPVGLCDILDVERSGSCSDYSFSATGIQLDADPEQNLIVKAYRLLQSEYDVPPVDISFIKQIPFGAGLGGGSSDAAFMLSSLNDLFELKISKRKLEKIAAEIGADCPFFIRNKPVFATGVGNEFSAIRLSLKKFYLLLVKPDVHVSTPEAYAKVTPKKPEYSLLESIQQPVSEWKHLIKNDFEIPIFEKYPIIGEIKEILYDLGAVYASMSGSGSAVYGIFAQEPVLTTQFDNYFVVGGNL